MKNQTTYIVAVAFHAFIGMIIYYNEALAKLYFFAALAYFLYRIINIHESQKVVEILKACAYFVGAELILRMTRGAISYEAAKYLVILFALMGMFYKGLSGKGYPYLFYIMFLVPSIFVASTTLSFDANFRTNIAFVLSGPICLGVAALFCMDKKITHKQIIDIIWHMTIPIIVLTAYLYFYTPSIRDVLSNTASNRAASGGFGPNQVATVLGLGMFGMTVRLFAKSPNNFLKLFNAIILILISYRAVVTFSRGGVIAAVVTIAAFIFIYYGQVNSRKKNQIVSIFVLFIMSLTITWLISSSQTEGYIDLRYANKDHLGRDKGDVTTGRGELFFEELEGFISNPFLGIGSSRAKDQRIEIDGQGVTSHSEVSRVLAEHGIFGVLILIILIFKPLAYRSNNKKNYFFYAFLCFWFATINHSSMRIAAPAFIYALSLLNIVHEKRIVYRKQVERLNS